MVNNIEIEGSVDIGADIAIIFEDYWNKNCFLQEVSTEIGNGTLSHIKKSIVQINSIGPESQVEELKQHVVDIAINLYKIDLFEQLKNSN